MANKVAWISPTTFKISPLKYKRQFCIRNSRLFSITLTTFILSFSIEHLCWETYPTSYSFPRSFTSRLAYRYGRTNRRMLMGFETNDWFSDILKFSLLAKKNFPRFLILHSAIGSTEKHMHARCHSPPLLYFPEYMLRKSNKMI